MSVPGANAKFVAENVRLSIRHGSELHRLGTCLCVRIPWRGQHDTCRGLWKGADDLYSPVFRTLLQPQASTLFLVILRARQLAVVAQFPKVDRLGVEPL